MSRYCAQAALNEATPKPLSQRHSRATTRLCDRWNSGRAACVAPANRTRGKKCHCYCIFRSSSGWACSTSHGTK